MDVFKRKGVLLVITTAVIVAITAFSAGYKEVDGFFSSACRVVISPVQSLFMNIGSGFSWIGVAFSDKSVLVTENESLKSEVAELKGKLIEFDNYKMENDSLRSALELNKRYDNFKKRAGNIVAKDPGNWFNTFTIDIGSSSGVGVDSPVQSMEGLLIGRVVQVSDSEAVVESVIDPWSSLNAVNSRTGELLIGVKGDISLSEKGLCRLDYVDQDVRVNDEIVTSGVSGIYPKGMIIGTVIEIIQSENESNSYAIVQPEVNLQKIREVTVLVPKKK